MFVSLVEFLPLDHMRVINAGSLIQIHAFPSRFHEPVTYIEYFSGMPSFFKDSIAMLCEVHTPVVLWRFHLLGPEGYRGVAEVNALLSSVASPAAVADMSFAQWNLELPGALTYVGRGGTPLGPEALNNALGGAVNRVKDCVEDRAAGIKEKLTRVINKAVRGKGKGKGKSPFSNQRTFDPSTHCRVVDIISPDLIVSNEFAIHLRKILPDALTQIYNDFVNPDDEWDAEDGYEVNDGLDYEATTPEHVRDESDGSKASAAQIAPKWDFSSGIN